jgi:DNA-binding SARP family transcriptional activator
VAADPCGNLEGAPSDPSTAPPRRRIMRGGDYYLDTISAPAGLERGRWRFECSGQSSSSTIPSTPSRSRAGGPARCWRCCWSIAIGWSAPTPSSTGCGGDEPPAQAKGTLHSYISKLRSAIGAAVGPAGGERIVRRSPGYQLVTLVGEVDADRLERTLALAEVAIRENRFAAASASIRQGLALVRGPLLGECRDEPYARPELARLEGIRLRALERRVDAELALGRHAALVGELEGLVAEHGLCERFQEQLMLALYRSGRQADALRVYQNAHRLLGEELGVLQAAWRRAVAWERQFVVIEADPGMGATRLGAEIANVARGEGAAILVGRAAGDALIPYFPFVEALGNVPAEELQLAVGPGAGYFADLLPGLGQQDGVRPRQPGAQASAHRYLMFEAVVTLLNGIGAAAGAVLILDDVHGADPSTLQLVEHLARHRSKGRLLIVATADASQSPGTRAGALLSGLVADGLATRLRPDGLSVDEVGDLLRAAAGRSDGILPGLAAAVHGLTMRMPLFVSELGKGLAELDARAVKEASDLPVSERIEAVLERGVNQVPPGVVAMLSTAAVIGIAFDAEVVAALSQQAVRALAGPLDTAIAAGPIAEDGVAGRYRFAHPLLHRAFQQRVGPSSRGEMHGELANILAGPGAPHGTPPGELAHHLKRAALHRARQAVTYAVRAGDHAMSVLAFEDSADFYSSALETLRTFGAQDLPLEGRIFLALGRAHHAAYQRIAAVAAFRQAAQLALRAADPDALAAATWGLMMNTEFSHADVGVGAGGRSAHHQVA